MKTCALSLEDPFLKSPFGFQRSIRVVETSDAMDNARLVGRLDCSTPSRANISHFVFKSVHGRPSNAGIAVPGCT